MRAQRSVPLCSLDGGFALVCVRRGQGPQHLIKIRDKNWPGEGGRAANISLPLGPQEPLLPDS